MLDVRDESEWVLTHIERARQSASPARNQLGRSPKRVEWGLAGPLRRVYGSRAVACCGLRNAVASEPHWASLACSVVSDGGAAMWLALSSWRITLRTDCARQLNAPPKAMPDRARYAW